MQKELERHFKEFLGVTNVMQRYIIACALGKRSMRDTWDKRDPKDWIKLAFNPFTTYEGGDFWCRIDDEWQKWLEAIDKESRL